MRSAMLRFQASLATSARQGQVAYLAPLVSRRIPRNSRSPVDRPARSLCPPSCPRRRRSLPRTRLSFLKKPVLCACGTRRTARWFTSPSVASSSMGHQQIASPPCPSCRGERSRATSVWQTDSCRARESYPPSRASSTSIQCLTGFAVPDSICVRQPILAVTIISGSPDCSAATLFRSSCADNAGCSSA